MGYMGFGTKKNASADAVIKEIREARQDKKEEKAKNLHEFRAQKEQEFIGILNDIRWSDSKLSPESIRKMSMPEYRMTDWQLRMVKLRQLMNNTLEYNVDISDLDNMMIDIAKKLSEAIVEGYEVAANAAVEGLVKLLTEIRNKIPAVSDKEAAKLTRRGVDYAQGWLNLIESFCKCDLHQKQLVNLKKSVDDTEQEEKEIFNTIKERMKDDEFVIALNAIMNNTGGKTPVEKEARDLMFRKALRRTISKMTTTIYEQHSLAQNVMKGRAQLLYRTLICAPVFEADYDAEYFNEMMENQRKELEKIDELFKRNDADFARIDGWLDDIKHNEGNDRVSATIAMEAAKAEEEFYQDMYKTGQDMKSQADALRKAAEARYKKESQQTFQAQREAIRQESMNVNPNDMIHN